MTFTVSATVNQKVQIGQEATPGAGGSAAKLLAGTTIEFSNEYTVKKYKTQGRRHSQLVETEMAWTSFSIGGDAEYSELPYLFEGLFGTVSPAATGLTTNTRSYNVLLQGALSPKTLVTQWGDANNVNIAAYCLPTELMIKHDREAGVSLTGAGIAQLFTTGGAFTSSPTEQSIQPILASQTNYYVDSTGAGVGTTQITDEVLDSEWGYKGLFGPRFASNRAYTSFASHVDLAPTPTLKMTIAEGTYARSLAMGGLYFVRINDVGLVLDNIQTVSLGSASAGTFTLTYKGQTTGTIAFNATAGTVQTALAALTTIGTGNVSVTGSAGGPYTVSFIGTLAQDTTAMTGNGAGLTGATFVITQAQTYWTLNQDMAVRCSGIKKFSDKKGIYQRSFEFDIVEDPTWNAAVKLSSITNIATL